MSVPEQNTYPETPEHSTTSPHDSAPHFSDLDPISRCDIQDDTDIPIEPPAFWGDSAENALSSPSISSSDDSLEEFFRLPDAQDDIPIDPAILGNHWPWEDGSLQQSVPQADNFINSETTCSYPDPPPVLHSPPNYHRGSCEKAGGQNGDAQTSDHSHIHDHQQLHPSQHNTDPDAFSPDGVCGDHHVGGQSKSSKWKAQQSDGRAHKWLQVPLMLPTREDSTLCSHFMQAPLDDRCNSFLGYLKVLYHIACLTLHRQRVKRDMRWQPVAQVPHMRLNKISVIVERSEEAPERICHGPWKRRAFC